MALVGLTDIFWISRTVVLARIPQQHVLGRGPGWIPVLRSAYAQIIKGTLDHITVIRGGYRSSMP
jgi:hypothetical protein